MDQKYKTISVDDQISQLSEPPLTYPPASPYIEEIFSEPMGEFNAFNDAIALQSFVRSVHGALKSNKELSIKIALGVLASSKKYPHLTHAIGAFTSVQYLATLFAADMARQQALKDTSVNRNFAYCAAMLLIAHTHKRLGKSNELVKALSDCQQHLENEIGALARPWINEILVSFFRYV